MNYFRKSAVSIFRTAHSRFPRLISAGNENLYVKIILTVQSRKCVLYSQDFTEHKVKKIFYGKCWRNATEMTGVCGGFDRLNHWGDGCADLC